MHFLAASSLLLAFGLSAVDAHMKMKSPKPYNDDSLNNSPLSGDGSDFPCKMQAGTYDSTGSTQMPLGSTQTLSFLGSAVHGGGSCQLSITYDENPTKESTFKVIHSIIGGCPADTSGNLPSDPNGNGAAQFTFQVPDNLPTGQATFAWTWFNKIGNREMYMNCAPVTITGDGGDKAAFDALPDMFTANIGGACTTSEGGDLEFPNPGQSVQKAGSGKTLPPNGCPAGSGSGSGSGAAPKPPSSPSATAPSGSGNVGTPSAPVSRPSNTGGIFVPNLPQQPAPTVVATTFATQPAASKPTAAPAPPATNNAPQQGVTTGAQTGPCNVEGAFICLPGGKAFQSCASGQWSIVMQMAAGTKCAMQAAVSASAEDGPGSTVAAESNTESYRSKNKRHLRFSHGHLRARAASF